MSHRRLERLIGCILTKLAEESRLRILRLNRRQSSFPGSRVKYEVLVADTGLAAGTRYDLTGYLVSLLGAVDFQLTVAEAAAHVDANASTVRPLYVAVPENVIRLARRVAFAGGLLHQGARF